MKRFTQVLTVALLLMLIAIPSYASDLKIAYIDGQRLVSESKAGTAALIELEQFQKNKQAEIDQKQTSIKKLGEEISVKGPSLSVKAKEELELRYQQQMRDLNRFIKDAQDEMKLKQVQLFKPITDELDVIIRNYGDANAIDLILDIRNPGVLYGSEKIDITKKLMKIYDKSWQEKKD